MLGISFLAVVFAEDAKGRKITTIKTKIISDFDIRLLTLRYLLNMDGSMSKHAEANAAKPSANAGTMNATNLTLVDAA